MTNAQLATLPLGAAIQLDDEIGQIVKAGTVVEIEWMDCTSIIFTSKPVWAQFVEHLEVA